MSTKRDRKHLETYFETGDRPTEEEFSELITSVINQEEDDIHGKDKKIGIGTDDPKAKLHVKGGNVRVDEALTGKDSREGMLKVFAASKGDEDGACMYMMRSDDGGSNSGGITFVAAGDGQKNGYDFVNHDQTLAPNDPNRFNNAMRIHGNGNVGMGIEDPDEKLSVKGNIKVETGHFFWQNPWDDFRILPANNEAAGRIEIFKASSGDPNAGGITFVTMGNGEKNGYRFLQYKTDDSSWTESIRINGAGKVRVGNHNSTRKIYADLEVQGQPQLESDQGIVRIEGPKTWQETNLRMGVVTSGKKRGWIQSHLGPLCLNTVGHPVGIGTDDPDSGSKLHIDNGNSAASGLRLSSGAGNNRILVSDSQGNASWQEGTVVTNGLWANVGNQNIRNGNAGKVEIGTVGGQGIHSKLQITGAYEENDPGNGVLRVQGTLGYTKANLHIGVNDKSVGKSGYSWIESHLGPLAINARPYQKVGIGTINPQEKLHLDGKFLITQGDPNPAKISAGGAGNHMMQLNSEDQSPGIAIRTGSNDVFNFYDDGTGGNPFTIRAHGPRGLRFYSNHETMRITESGNVGIGTGSTNYKLDVNGSVNFSGNVRIKNAFPMYYQRFYIGEDGNNSHGTGKLLSDYGAAVVTGFAAVNGDPVNNSASFDFYCYTLVESGEWVIRADFTSNTNKHEEWSVDVLFIRTELVGRGNWPGWISGA